MYIFWSILQRLRKIISFAMTTTIITNLLKTGPYTVFPRTLELPYGRKLTFHDSILSRLEAINTDVRAQPRIFSHRRFYWLQNVLQQYRLSPETRCDLEKGEVELLVKEGLEQQERVLREMALADVECYQDRDSTIIEYLKLCLTKPEKVPRLDIRLELADYYPAYALSVARHVEHKIHHLFKSADTWQNKGMIMWLDVTKNMQDLLKAAMYATLCPQAFFMMGVLQALGMPIPEMHSAKIVAKNLYLNDFRNDDPALICSAYLGSPDPWILLGNQFKDSDPSYSQYCFKQAFGKGNLYADVQYTLGLLENHATSRLAPETLNCAALLLAHAYISLAKEYVPSPLYFVNSYSQEKQRPLIQDIKLRLDKLLVSLDKQFTYIRPHYHVMLRQIATISHPDRLVEMKISCTREQQQRFDDYRYGIAPWAYNEFPSVQELPARRSITPNSDSGISSGDESSDYERISPISSRSTTPSPPPSFKR